MDSEADAQRMLAHWRLEGWREVGRELGRGSYAAVVEVDYKGLKCVGKKIHRVLYEQGERELVRRFEEECRLLGQLRHPHIVQFLGVYFEEYSNVPVLVMEFLPTTLAQSLDLYGLIPEEINFSILRDVALGLRYLHERPQPIVHRDLSANNVLLTRDMTAKISDLGVARMLGLTPLQMSRMTQGPGTPCYMPPEAMIPDPQYDVKIDIFSYGVMIVHVLSARWPFPKEAVRVEDPSAPSLLTPVSELDRRQDCIEKIVPDHPLMQLLSQCLHNSPIHRPSVVEVCQQVSELAPQHPPDRMESLQHLKNISEENRFLIEESHRSQNVWDQNLQQLQTALAESQERVQEFEAQVESAVATESALRAELKTAIAAEDVLQIDIEKLRLESDEVQRCNVASTSKIEALRASLDELRSEVDTLEATLAAKDRAHQAQLQALEECHEVEINTLKLQHAVPAETNTGKTEIDHPLQPTESQTSSELRACQLQLRGKQAQLQALEAEKAAQQVELEGARARLSRKEATIETLREQLERAQETLLHSNQTLTPLKSGAKLTWKKCADVPVYMYVAHAVLMGDNIYIGGGLDPGNLDFVPDVLKYSITENEWFKLAPAPVIGFGLGRLGGDVVLVGGKTDDEHEFTGKIHSLDAESQQWIEKLPAMPTARRMPTVISHKRTVLVVCGGVGGNGILNTVEMFNSETLEWHTLTPLPVPAMCMSTAIIGNTCFLMGGVDKDSYYCSLVLQCRLDHILHTPTAATWEVLPDTDIIGPTAAVLGEHLLSIGGIIVHHQPPSPLSFLGLGRKQSTSSRAANCIYVYHPVTSQWLLLDKLPTFYASGSVVSLPENKLLVTGGTAKSTWLGEFH